MSDVAHDGRTGPDERFGLRAGALLGRYCIVRRLATGGMAELYLARASDRAGTVRPYALKRVRPVLASDPDFVDGFVKEARISAHLDHPNIVRVLDVGRDGDEHWFVMEYVHGAELRGILRRAVPMGGLTLAATLAIVDGIARGLHYAHEFVGADRRPLSIVHRDVSPSNVLVSFAGEVKLVDFGIAKVVGETQQTRAGVVKGKLGYMSPEQCIGDPLDRRSDIFSTGILLWELSTGQRLFRAESEMAVINKTLSGNVPMPSSIVPGYPAELEDAVMRALQVDPAQRFATAAELQAAIERVISERRLPSARACLPAVMAQLFGAPPMPDLELPDGDDEDALTVVAQPRSVRPTERTSARRPWVALGLLALGIAAGTFGVLAFDPWSHVAAREGGTTADASTTTPIDAPTEVPTPVPTLAPESTPLPAPTPTPAPVAVPALAADVAEPVAAKAERRPRSRAEKRKRDIAAKPTPAPEAMRLFPRAYEDRLDGKSD